MHRVLLYESLQPSSISCTLTLNFSVTKIKVAFTLEDLESLEISNIYDFLPEFLQGADKITVSASDTPAVIFAYGGNDTVDASKVTDDVLLFGGGDTDVESGSDIDTGNDILKGGAGDDALFGQDGNDTLTGGLGNDSLLGGLGKDKLTGGLGDDLFIFDIQELDANASDSITDFKMVLGNSDSIEIYDSLDEEFIGRYLWANTISEIVGTADDIIYESKTGKLYYNDGVDFTLICGMVKGITEQAFYNYFEPA
jgi:Ca2+-binding RTX toxin-like protein